MNSNEIDVAKVADKLIAETEQQLQTDEAILGIKPHRAWEITNPAGEVFHVRTPAAAAKYVSQEGYGVVPLDPPSTTDSDVHDFPNDVAHRYADFACDLVQAIRNVKDGISSIEVVCDRAERNMASVRKFQESFGKSAPAATDQTTDSQRIDWIEDWVVVQFPEGTTGNNIREMVDSGRKIIDAQVAATEAGELE